jgi:TctA family transporter
LREYPSSISYYLFNIVSIFANGAAKYFFGDAVRFPDWALVPIILLLVWWGIGG